VIFSAHIIFGNTAVASNGWGWSIHQSANMLRIKRIAMENRFVFVREEL